MQKNSGISAQRTSNSHSQAGSSALKNLQARKVGHSMEIRQLTKLILTFRTSSGPTPIKCPARWAFSIVRRVPTQPAGLGYLNCSPFGPKSSCFNGNCLLTNTDKSRIRPADQGRLPSSGSSDPPSSIEPLGFARSVASLFPGSRRGRF